jgi:hypothetical protein
MKPTLPLLTARFCAVAAFIPTLRRMSIGGRSLTDVDLTLLASVTQPEELAFVSLDLPKVDLKFVR